MKRCSDLSVSSMKSIPPFGMRSRSNEQMCANRNVELIWNKGIAAQCDWRIPDEFSGGRTYASVRALRDVNDAPPDDLISYPQVFCDVRDGDLIWVRLTWLRSF